MDENALDLSIDHVAACYASGDLTPRRLIVELMARIRACTDRAIWITLLNETQLEPYLLNLKQQAPAALPLYGIPFAIKDNIDLADVPTTAACPDYAYRPTRSATVVERLIAAGAIPIGKTNMDQFATGLVGTRSPYGAPRNSFNPSYISGGSSSGSAVAVALGQVSFALGTDTAGSGRVPAAFNNLVGVKPSRGLISTRGVVPACRSLDCVSLFTLNTDDARRCLEIAVGFDADDPYAREAPRNSGPPIGSVFRFGVPRASQLEFFGDDAAADCFERALRRFVALGGEPVEIDFSAVREVADFLYDGPWVAERYAAIESFIKTKPDALLPVTRGIIEAAAQRTASECFTAQCRLQTLIRTAGTQLRGLDFLLTPTTGTLYTHKQVAAAPLELNRHLGYYTNFMNLLDMAAVAVPAGFRADGLPFGMTLCAPAFQDDRLLHFAERFLRALRPTMGATQHRWQPYNDLPASQDQDKDWTEIMVCGAHMSGLPLNHQLSQRGGTLLNRTQSRAAYRLYALADGPPHRPGLVRDLVHGAAIEVEVWSLPTEHFTSFMDQIPTPLGIGHVELADGSWVKGFI